MAFETPWTAREVDDFLRLGADFRSHRIVTATKLSDRLRWVTSRGSIMSASAGDWLLDDGTARWTIDDHVFRATYTLVVEGKYRKVVPVRGRRMTESAIIATLEGPSKAAAGDWLVRNPAGDSWPVTDEEFRRRYDVP